MRFFFISAFIFQLSAFAQAQESEPKLKWDLPCTITVAASGKAYEPKVERQVCKYLLDLQEGERERFNGMSGEEQRRVLRRSARAVEEARLKKEEEQKKAAAKQKEKADAQKSKAAALGAADATSKAGTLDTLYTGDSRGSRASTAAPGNASTALGARAAAGGLADDSSRRAESRFATAAAPPPSLDRVGAVKVADLKKRGYTPENVIDLELGVAAASQATAKLHEKNPSNVAAAYGSGTMTNMEDTAKWAFSGGSYELKRGCISHQQTVLAALQEDRTLDYKPIVVGAGMEHHAVVAYPKGTDWQKTGVVLDAWKKQDASPEKMTYTIDEWKDTFATLEFIGGTRVEKR